MDNYFDNIDINDSKAWLSLSEPVMKSDVEVSQVNETEVTSENRTAKVGHSAPVLTMQLIFCLLVLIFAFVSKNYFSAVYSKLNDLYQKEINASMFFIGDFSKIDYSELFGASFDEF